MTNNPKDFRRLTEERAAINQRDLELINASIDVLTREALDVDKYRAPIEYESDEQE